ncbi:MAG: polysaccharide export protein EpsE [Burkholderiaceae bacterium]|nr:polysaccharide export protein EpsE [Burkholderiaceae bacterium]
MMIRLLFTTLLALFMVAPVVAQPSQGIAVAPDYRLGPGDVIRIMVFQNPDLSFDTQLSESGYVSYPLLGRIKIGGTAVSLAEKRIADGLRNGNFVKQPHVSIMVVQVRGNLVSVLGQVNRPGRFPIETLDMRLTDVLAIAGGIAAGGADKVVLVGSRGGRQYRTEVDLPKLFEPGGRDKDLLVVNGDVIWVDRAPLAYIYGEVQRPGTVALRRSMTVMQALAASGGLNQRGTEKGLRVHRKDAEGKLQVLEPGLNDELLDDDVVFVRESLF